MNNFWLETKRINELIERMVADLKATHNRPGIELSNLEAVREHYRQILLGNDPGTLWLEFRPIALVRGHCVPNGG